MPTRATPQSEHVAAKVRWLLLLEGVTPTLLGVACGVKSQSVYDWRDYGRVAKRHIPVLAEVSGTTERWWLTPDAPIPPTSEWQAGGRSPSTLPLLPAPEPTPIKSRRQTSPSLKEALPVVLEAIASAKDKKLLRAALSVLIDDDSDLYRQRVMELLGATREPSKETLRKTG